jgi:hypothetical protein
VLIIKRCHLVKNLFEDLGVHSGVTDLEVTLAVVLVLGLLRSILLCRILAVFDFLFFLPIVTILLQTRLV